MVVGPHHGVDGADPSNAVVVPRLAVCVQPSPPELEGRHPLPLPTVVVLLAHLKLLRRVPEQHHPRLPLHLKRPRQAPGLHGLPDGPAADRAEYRADERHVSACRSLCVSSVLVPPVDILDVRQEGFWLLGLMFTRVLCYCAMPRTLTNLVGS